MSLKWTIITILLGNLSTKEAVEFKFLKKEFEFEGLMIGLNDVFVCLF